MQGGSAHGARSKNWQCLLLDFAALLVPQETVSRCQAALHTPAHGSLAACLPLLLSWQAFKAVTNAGVQQSEHALDFMRWPMPGTRMPAFFMSSTKVSASVPVRQPSWKHLHKRSGHQRAISHRSRQHDGGFRV